MVNPAICRKCSRCQGIDLPERDDDSLVAEAMIHCGPENLLVVSSPIPDDCLYRLEHSLLQEDTEQLQEGWDEERHMR